MKSKMDKKKNKTYSILNLILIYIITRFITYNFFEIYSNPDVIRPDLAYFRVKISNNRFNRLYSTFTFTASIMELYCGYFC